MNSNSKNRYSYYSRKTNASPNRIFCYETSQLIGECQEDIKNGFYKEARKKINTLKAAGNKGVVWKMQSNLETREYNFNRAFDLIDRCQSIPTNRTKNQDDVVFYSALIHLTRGDLNIASGLFELLLQSRTHNVLALKYLVYIDLIKGNYNRALKTISNLPLSFQEGHELKQIKLYIASILGDDIPQDSEIKNTYFYKRLNDEHDGILISHLKHLYTGDLDDEVYSRSFDESVDFHSLVAEVNAEISNLTPTYLDYRKRYIVRFPQEIGYVGGQATKAVCILTFPHNGQIFNITPIQLSKQFDKENFITRTRKKN